MEWWEAYMEGRDQEGIMSDFRKYVGSDVSVNLTLL
jgi:hypothetical protein